MDRPNTNNPPPPDLELIRHLSSNAKAIQEDADAILEGQAWTLDNRSRVQIRLLTWQPLAFRVKGVIITLDDDRRTITVESPAPGREE